MKETGHFTRYAIAIFFSLLMLSAFHTHAFGENDVSKASVNLELLGPSRIFLNPRPSFKEPGFLAYDDEGNDLGEQVTVTGEISPDKPGDYKLIYAIESAGEVLSSVERTITVVAFPDSEDIAPQEKTIYLTFDDGPGEYTDPLLDLLEEYNAKVTFFISGKNSEYHHCVTRAFELGHSIGVHTYDHYYEPLYRNLDYFFDDFNKVEDIIYSLTGQYTPLYRFPGGSVKAAGSSPKGYFDTLASTLEDMGYKYFDWNVSSGDCGRSVGPAGIAQRIILDCQVNEFPVVLQHDTLLASVRAVESVLIWGRENGYTFKALDMSSPAVHSSNVKR